MKQKKYTIATLGSHSALQILKGAKDEGFKTLLITLPNRISFYKRFSFIDEIVSIPTFADLPRLEKKLKRSTKGGSTFGRENIIIIPHGSFVAYLGIEGNKKITLPYFGNKKVLDWEADRLKQRQWLEKAKINVPKEFNDIDHINYPVIVKSYGAAGGKGYFYAKSKKDFKNKIKTFKDNRFIIQEYVIGVSLYIHYFYSPLTNTIEILSMDRRYETNVDSLGRIPLVHQKNLDIEPSYVVVGNSSLTLRESLLPEAYKMGEQVVAESKKLIDKNGLYGPFCLETVITPDQKIFVIEISCRIVAGTNLFINGSPYAWLSYDEPMSMGRRIAREIKLAIKKRKLYEIID